MIAGRETRHRNAFDRIVEASATGLGNGIGWLAQHGFLFMVYGVVWAAVGVGLLVSETTVTEAWTFVGTQNLIVQAVLWLLFLPAMAGLWIWHADWPLLFRALLVIGLGAWNLLVFLPGRQSRPEPASTDASSVGG